MDESTQILFQEIVPEIHHEIIITEKVRGDENTVSKSEWLILRNESESRPELRTIAQSSHDFDPGVTNDHADISDARCDHGLNTVKQDWLISYWHQLFGAGMSDRSETGSSTPSQNQCFHVSPSRSSAMLDFRAISYRVRPEPMVTLWAGRSLQQNNPGPPSLQCRVLARPCHQWFQAIPPA